MTRIPARHGDCARDYEKTLECISEAGETLKRSEAAADIAPPVAVRLIAEWDSAHDELGALVESVQGRDFTHAE